MQQDSNADMESFTVWQSLYCTNVLYPHFVRTYVYVARYVSITTTLNKMSVRHFGLGLDTRRT